MVKFLWAGLLLVGLIGCGSEDGNLSNLDLAHLRGLEQAPALTPATVENGISLSLNTQANGTLSEGDSHGVMFTALQDEPVLILLSSTAADLDLYVESNDGLFFESASFASNERLYIDVKADVTYSIFVDAYEGGGEYELQLVQANRDSLQLSENEYLIRFTEQETETCGEEEIQYEHELFYTVNFVDGYMASARGDSVYFDEINENSFSVTSSFQNENYMITGTIYLTVNPDDGSISGSSTSRSEEIVNTISYVCTGSSSIDGQIVL